MNLKAKCIGERYYKNDMLISVIGQKDIWNKLHLILQQILDIMC